MKRFSKALVTLLVVITILGTLSVGFAAPVPSDVKGTDYEEAVNRLAALNIMGGFPDGTFKPGDALTRAQAARIVVSALGLNKAADLAKGATQFTDVPADHWASGYINIATSQGIIVGMGDGTFAPEANVTYAQILKMMLMALNYGPTLKKATWPAGYISKADEIGLSEDVAVAANVPATRGDVAKIVDNALTIPMLKQNQWGDLETYVPDPSTTLLSKLGAKEATKRVTEIARVNDKLDANEVKIDGTVYTLPEGTNPESIFGHEIKFWANNDNEILFFVDKTDAENVLVDEWGTVNDDYTKFATGAKIYIDGAVKNSADVTNDALYGTFIIDPEEDEIVFADLHAWDKSGILVKSVNAAKYYIDFVGGRLTVDDEGLTVLLNGAPIDFADIQKDDVVYYEADDNVIVVVRDAVTGELGKATSSKVTVDGASITVASGAKVALDGKTYSAGYNIDTDKNISDLLGEQVTVIKNIFGEAAFIVGDVEGSSDTNFALVTKAWSTDDNYVKLWKTDGSVATYVYAEGDARSLLDSWVEYSLNSDGEIDGLTKLTLTDMNTDPVASAASAYLKLKSGTLIRVSSDTKVVFYNGTDKEVLNYADIVAADSVSGMTVKYYQAADSKYADLIVVTDKGSLYATDTTLAVVISKAKTANGWEVTYNADGEEFTKLVIASDEATVKATSFARGTLFEFKETTAGKLDITTLVVPDLTAIAASDIHVVTDVDSGFVTVKDGTEKTYYVTDDTVIFDATAIATVTINNHTTPDDYTDDTVSTVTYDRSKALTVADIAAIGTGNFVYLVLDGQDIVAIYIMD